MSDAAPPPVPSPANGLADPRIRRAILRAPAWFAAFLVHLAVVVCVLTPALFGGRAPDPPPVPIRIILADMSRGDDAPPGPKPGDAPLPEATPEAPPAPGPAEAPEAPPQAETPAPDAPAADVTEPQPDPGAVSEAIARLNRSRGVGAGAAPPAPGGGVPTGTPGALGGVRNATGRGAAVARHGGGTGSEGAVEAGLRWLARHQGADGRFAGHDFAQVCAGLPCDGPGYITYDVGLTGLALAAFAGAGYSHREGPHARTVSRAAAYLRERQDPDGFFFRREDLRDMYNHACATFGLAELHACTGDPELREPLDRAVRALLVAQQPGGGWTYAAVPPDGPRNDVSITGFALQALIAAREGGIRVPDLAFGRILAFLRRQTAPETGWVRYADKGINDLREGLGVLAVALLGRMLLGDSRDEAGFRAGLAHLTAAQPALEPGERPRSLNQGHYPLYYGTCAAYLAGGKAWARWNPAAANVLVAAQRTTGCAHGSWDPAGKWAVNGGRVYATAMSILTLEIYYKYLPSFLVADAPAVEAPPDAGPAGAPDGPADPAAARARRLRGLLDGAGGR